MATKLVALDPEELRFQFELEKPSHCDLKVSNTSDKNVAFKVKTTSPKKYFVRPNTGVIQPYDSCIIRVTLQAQLEYPPDMQCKDKFLLQSTLAPAISESEELPQNTFSKEPGKLIEEYKLKVVYIARTTTQGNSDDTPKQSADPSFNQAVQTAKTARDAAVKETTQLQQELDTLKKKNQKPSSSGFSIKLAIAAGVIGIIVGIIIKFVLASPSESLPISPAPAAE